MAVSNTKKSPLIMTALNDQDTRAFHITWIRWNGNASTVADETLEVSDLDGNVIWRSVADGKNFIDMEPVFDTYRGVKVTDRTSGEVLVYYR